MLLVLIEERRRQTEDPDHPLVPDAVVDRTVLAADLDEAACPKRREMARYGRLRDAEALAQLADRELALLAEQLEDAEARRVGQRPEAGRDRINRCRPAPHSVRILSLSDLRLVYREGMRRVVAGRRIGAVEAEVLERLWEAGRPLGVREVMARLTDRRRAYTTVVTILTRLVEKGLARKIPAGRTFVYEAAGSREELAADAISKVLEASEDPRAVLSRFVERLSDDPDLLRQLADLVEREGRP